MPRQLLRKYLPTAERLRRTRSLRRFRGMLGNPALWHLNRRSLSGGAFIGVFSGMLPIPFQTLLAAILAIRFQYNLPAALILVWVSNPFTWVPILYFNYRLGAWILGLPGQVPEDAGARWFFEQLLPLWTGSLLAAVLAGALAYLLFRIIWRIATIRNWNARLARRRQENKEQKQEDNDEETTRDR